jgi:carboxypeptidase Q
MEVKCARARTRRRGLPRPSLYNSSPMRTKAVLLLVVMASCLSLAQSNDKVMQEALSASSPMAENLRVLTDEIGGRVPGTPQLTAAVQWAVERFKQAGADSVHTEEFTIAQSWAEGATEVSVVAPVAFHIAAHSVAWAPALARTTARVVDVGTGSPEDFAKAGDIAGAIVLVHTTILAKWQDLFEEYYRAPDILQRAVKGKAVAVAFMATREHDVLYRHQNTMNGHMDVIPQVIVAREEGLRIARLLEHGKQVKMTLAIPNHIGGPVKSQNVIAEIKGSELPNEVVILAAHLDSWELGTGALDNGCNDALVIDAVRAIKAAGVKPRRTMRFILFSGEEQGLLGSWAYVRAHRSELDNVAAEIVIDSGIGEISGFTTGGRKDVDAAVKPLLEPFAKWKATEITNDADIGTDNYDFFIEGVPTLSPNQAEANYLKNYHATSDTFDKVDFDQLKKNEAICAELLTELANAPERIGPRLTRAQIEATFAETHLDNEMKGSKLWEGWMDGSRGRQP